MPLTFPSAVTTFSTPLERWDELFYLLASWRAAVAEFPGCQSVYVYASSRDGNVDCHVIVNWDTVSERDAWLDKAYTAGTLLAELDPPIAHTTTSAERIF
jgi:hypothetical protein